MLDDEGATDVLDVDGHPFAVGGMGESRGQVSPGLRGAVDVFALIDVEEPVGNVDCIRRRVDVELRAALDEQTGSEGLRGSCLLAHSVLLIIQFARRAGDRACPVNGIYAAP